MIKKRLSLFILFTIYYSLLPGRAAAIYDPLSVPNNRIGVHILEPSEVAEAAKLVNTNGGDWGYVTVPIRSDSRDQAKWKEFFNNCRQLHLIPIIRLMTYVDKDAWETPTVYDLVDFANFLNEMPWPTNNRYIILFNETNHSKEWGGHLGPDQYAKLLVDAKNIFKSRSEDFFMLSGGLDMSAPTNRTSQDALSYYKEMTRAVPKWIDAVDGLSFHPYPNPAFSSPVTSTTRYGIKSYTYELKYLKSLGLARAASLPIFITETGKPAQGNFYTTAMTTVWTESNIVAITPFILFAASPDFQKFSLLDINRQPTTNYKDILNLSKNVGSPLLNPNIPTPLAHVPFSTPAPAGTSKGSIWSRLKDLLNTPLTTSNVKDLKIKDINIQVEIMDTDQSRAQGLSGRPNLPENAGMLFVFPEADLQMFWMKDMNFALDMIWLKDNTIVAISENVPPPAQTNGVPQTVSPAMPVNQVLEVNAGFVKKNDIKIGDTITY